MIRCATIRHWLPCSTSRAGAFPASRRSIAWSTLARLAPIGITSSTTTCARSSVCSSTSFSMLIPSRHRPGAGPQCRRRCRSTASRRAGIFTGYYDCYCYLPVLRSAAGICSLPSCARRASMPLTAASPRSPASWRRSVRAGQQRPSLSVPTVASAAMIFMTWCEANDGHYVLGLAGNERLVVRIAPEMKAARRRPRGRGSRRACSPTSRVARARAGALSAA